MRRHVRIVFSVAAVMGAAATSVAGAAPTRDEHRAPRGETGAVLEWNQHATDALVGSAGQAPPVAAVHMAIVQAAVYDAVNAIDRGHEPYLVAPAARRWYSTDAAAAAAAHRVLVSVLPTQQTHLDDLYTASLADIPDGRAEDGGVAVGEAAAAATMAARADDGRYGPFRFPAGTAPGQWRPTPPSFASDPSAWVSDVTPFLLERADQFRSRGPNALTSPRYSRDLAEVSEVGSATSSSRTADQTDAARFWVENGVAMWSRITRSLSAERHLDNVDNALLFARVHLTAADAAIACYDDKAHWGTWRPITAIREADTDGNPATVADPAWTPLIATPAFPEHPSGHGCLSGSIASTLRSFFGSDRVRFSATSTTSGTTRTFTRFSDAIDEVVDARVWSGIHFRTADEQGATIGHKVARWSRIHYFRPTRSRQRVAGDGRIVDALHLRRCGHARRHRRPPDLRARFLPAGGGQPSVEVDEHSRDGAAVVVGSPQHTEVAMPSKSANVKNEKQYEALKDKGMSKERAAKIANSPGASKRGGKKSGSGGNAKQGGTTAQHKAAGRKGGKAAARKS